MRLKSCRKMLSTMNAQSVIKGMLKLQIQSKSILPSPSPASPSINDLGELPLSTFARLVGTTKATFGLSDLNRFLSNALGRLTCAGGASPPSYQGAIVNGSLYSLQTSFGGQPSSLLTRTKARSTYRRGELGRTSSNRPSPPVNSS